MLNREPFFLLRGHTYLHYSLDDAVENAKCADVHLQQNVTDAQAARLIWVRAAVSEPT